MSYFYYIALVLIFGLLMGKVISYLKLPKVTGYLIAGVLIGPFGLRLISNDAIKGLTIISGGRFNISVDGDLFKVTIKFNKISE